MSLFGFNVKDDLFESWQRGILFSVLITGFLLFFLGGPDYYSARSFRQFWNLGHIVFFSALTYGVLTSENRLAGKPYEHQFLWSIFLALGLGVLVEIGQYGISRTPDSHDILRNLIGALFALVFLVPKRKSMTRVKRRLARLIVCVMIVLEIVPFAVSLADEIVAKKQFPLLSGFEIQTEVSRWRGDTDVTIVSTVSIEGKHSLQVNLDTTLYSGVSLSYFPGNWDGYSTFRFSVFNPSPEPLKIICRIHDRKHNEGGQGFSDRFNRGFILNNGWNTIDISLEDVISAPETRSMDIGNIAGVAFFATRLSERGVIYLDDVRLTDGELPQG